MRGFAPREPASAANQGRFPGEHRSDSDQQPLGVIPEDWDLAVGARAGLGPEKLSRPGCGGGAVRPVRAASPPAVTAARSSRTVGTSGRCPRPGPSASGHPAGLGREACTTLPLKHCFQTGGREGALHGPGATSRGPWAVFAEQGPLPSTLRRVGPGQVLTGPHRPALWVTGEAGRWGCSGASEGAPRWPRHRGAVFSSAGATVVVLQPDLQAAPARWAPRCAGPPRGRPRTALGPTRTAPGRGGRDTGPGGRHRRADVRFQAGPHLPREVPAALGRWPGAARAQPWEVLAPGSQRRRGWSWPGWEEGLAGRVSAAQASGAGPVGRPSPELAPPVGPVRHGEAASLQLLDVHGQQARRGQGGRGAGPPAFHQTQAVAL